MAALLPLWVLASDTAEAQRVSARVDLPGVSVGVNTPPPYYGRTSYRHYNGYPNRIAMQRARVHQVKRMAARDGYISRREYAMIRTEERQLAYMTHPRGRRF